MDTVSLARPYHQKAGRRGDVVVALGAIGLLLFAGPGSKGLESLGRKLGVRNDGPPAVSQMLRGGPTSTNQISPAPTKPTEIKRTDKPQI